MKRFKPGHIRIYENENIIIRVYVLARARLFIVALWLETTAMQFLFRYCMLRQQMFNTNVSMLNGQHESSRQAPPAE